jgi:hypothetical protein
LRLFQEFVVNTIVKFTIIVHFILSIDVFHAWCELYDPFVYHHSLVYIKWWNMIVRVRHNILIPTTIILSSNMCPSAVKRRQYHRLSAAVLHERIGRAVQRMLSEQRFFSSDHYITYTVPIWFWLGVVGAVVTPVAGHVLVGEVFSDGV